MARPAPKPTARPEQEACRNEARRGFLLSCVPAPPRHTVAASANRLRIVVVGRIGKPDCAASKEAGDVLQPMLLGVLLCVCEPALAQSTIPASSADWILDGDQATGTFGTQVEPAGDIDGDGYDDGLIGDSEFDGALDDGAESLSTVARPRACGGSRMDIVNDAERRLARCFSDPRRVPSPRRGSPAGCPSRAATSTGMGLPAWSCTAVGASLTRWWWLAS